MATDGYELADSTMVKEFIKDVDNRYFDKDFLLNITKNKGIPENLSSPEVCLNFFNQEPFQKNSFIFIMKKNSIRKMALNPEYKEDITANILMYVAFLKFFSNPLSSDDLEAFDKHYSLAIENAPVWNDVHKRLAVLHYLEDCVDNDKTYIFKKEL